MPFLALEFPRRLAFEAQRSATWLTTLAKTFDGTVQANQEWVAARHEFDVSLAIRTATDYRQVATHFYEARGRAHWFPFRDPLDHACTADEGVATLVSGSTYQLGKRYGTANPFVRKITRPLNDGSATFYRVSDDSPPIVTVITPTVDYDTGRITVTGHADGDTYQWSGGFFVPTEYAADTMPAAVPDRRHDGELLVSCDSVLLIEHRE